MKKYYAIMYSHDGALLVELENYNTETRKLLEKMDYTYSLGGIIEGNFVGDVHLGCHMMTLDEFIEDQSR